VSILSGQTDIFKKSGVLGIDESGKGDFLGPLVIGGVLADDKGGELLKKREVRDSKKISENRILELSKWIKDNFVHSMVVIGPEKYNQLYKKIGNLNKLLAWGHSRIIENIAAENQIDLAVSDKFGRDDFIEKALMKNGRSIKLRQQVRAEAIVQVAAGSILARAGYIQQMKKLSDMYGIVLPKGAGSQVDEAAKSFIAKYGRDELGKIAKLHFKNYQKVCR
jgi:ribonuclease HIII